MGGGAQDEKRMVQGGCESDEQGLMGMETAPYALLHGEAVPCSSGLSTGRSLLPQGLHPASSLRTLPPRSGER